MMTSKFYSNIDTLHNINTDLLCELIKKFHSYFSPHKVLDEKNNINYEALHNVLLKLNRPKEDEIPDELLDILHSIDDMATPENSEVLLDDIMELQPEYALDKSDHSPIDIALYCRLHFPKIFENRYALTRLSKQRSFEYYQGKMGQSSRFIEPKEAQRQSIQKSILGWCESNKRPPFVKCLIQKKLDNIYWIIIVHGDPLRREAKISEETDISSVFYYPRTTDLIIYDKTKNRLQLKCSGKKLTEKYRKVIGEILFNDSDYFDNNSNPFTLAPLIDATNKEYDWCQVSTIQAVKLSSLTIIHTGDTETRRTSGDYYPTLVNRNIASTNKLRITEAKFNIKQIDQANYRSISIKSDRVTYVRNEDSLAFENWLTKHGFALHE